MPRLRKPRAVGPGDTLAVVAPAFCIDPERLERGCACLRGVGFRIHRRPDLTARAGYLAGDDARRADELSEAVRDPQVAGILCVRGGWGCHRIMSRLDPHAFREARKPLVGFSDVTTLLLWQRRAAGLVGLHGPMFDGDDGPEGDDLERLVAVLGGAVPAPLVGVEGDGGRAEGPVVGGSLTLLAASLGTPWEVDTRGALLCFEDVGEKPYALDRLLHHLRAAGKLDAAAGFGVGRLLGCTDPKRERPTALEVVREVLAPLGKPLALGLPFGHGRPNLTWPVGIRGWIDGGRAELGFSEAGVSRR